MKQIGEGNFNPEVLDPEESAALAIKGDPKLYVDVNVGRQSLERIIVYEGDTAESLAKEFCHKNNLPEEMEEKLRISLDA